MADRQRNAIETRLRDGMKKQIEAAEVASPKDGGSKSSSGSTETPKKSDTEKSTDPEKASTKSDSGEPSTASAEKSTSSDTASERETRYDIKSLRNWARKNPEQASEFLEVLGATKDQTAEWVRVQNKFRKRHSALDEREKALTERETAMQTEAAGTVEMLQPIADMFEAVHAKQAEDAKSIDWGKVDFDAGDQAFKKLTGVPIDEYMRHRARKGIAVNPEMRELKLENERLRKEAEKAKGKEPEKKTEPRDDTPPPTLAKMWESEVDEGHAIRQFDGWQKMLTKAMAPYYDPELDEYSKDPEEIANRLVKQKLAELEPAEPEEERPTKRPQPPPRRAAAHEPPPRRERRRNDDSEAALMRRPPPREIPTGMPKDMTDRTRWAIERAQARARGEHVE
jgi:hypothetical protein